MANIKKNEGNILILLLSCWVSEGGIQQVNKSLLKLFAELKNRNISVLILLDNPNDINLAIQQNPKVKRLKIRGFSGNKIKFTLAYLKELLKRNYSFIWFDHINLAPFMILAAMRKIRYSLMIYGVDVWGKISVFKKIALRSAQHILSISKHTKEKAKQQADIFEKAEVCYLGTDLQLSSSFRNSNIEEIESILRDRKIILMVGRISRNKSFSKGHQELIEAINLLKDKIPEVLLIIVGRGMSKDTFEKIVNKKKLNKNIFFAGFVSNEKLQTYYSQCDVFAMPSRGEGFGLVYLEAMAHGKPCIGSNVDAAKEIILDGETGFCVDPKNINGLAECLFQLLTNSELKMKMGKAGKKRYLENFTEQKFHDRFMRINENI